MNILVTGAAGFIGFHLTKELVKQGHRVRGLLLPQENDEALADLGVEILRGDLTAPDSLTEVAAGMDIVYHLAARTLDWGTRQQFEAVMVDGTRNLLEASSRDITRFVYCSLERLICSMTITPLPGPSISRFWGAGSARPPQAVFPSGWPGPWDLCAKSCWSRWGSVRR